MVFCRLTDSNVKQCIMIYFHTAQYFLQGRLLLYNYVVPNKIIILLVSVFFFLFFFFFLSCLDLPFQRWTGVWHPSEEEKITHIYMYSMTIQWNYFHIFCILALLRHFQIKLHIMNSGLWLTPHKKSWKFTQFGSNSLKMMKMGWK